MKTLKPLILCAAAAISLTLSAETSRSLSYAIEDAAFQAVARLNADARVAHVKRITFVRLALPDPELSFKVDSSEAQTFEAALLSVPSKFQFVVHHSHESDLKEIFDVFDKAKHFSNRWDPSTCPALKNFKLADVLLLAKVIDGTENEKTRKTTIRISLRLVEVSTARTLWGGNVEGVWQDAGPENQQMTLEARRTFEAAAKDAVAKLPTSVDGYGVFLLPFDGPAGRAMTQIFLNALTEAGRQEKIAIYDLPNGNVADRQLARFLRERAGTNQALDESILKKVETRAKADGKKLAILTGMVTVSSVEPKTLVDPTGFLDAITASRTDAKENPVRFNIVADFKFRDISDRFKVLAAVSGAGEHVRDVAQEVGDQFRSFITARNVCILVGCVLGLVILFVIIGLMTRVR